MQKAKHRDRGYLSSLDPLPECTPPLDGTALQRPLATRVIIINIARPPASLVRHGSRRHASETHIAPLRGVAERIRSSSCCCCGFLPMHFLLIPLIQFPFPITAPPSPRSSSRLDTQPRSRSPGSRRAVSPASVMRRISDPELLLLVVMVSAAATHAVGFAANPRVPGPVGIKRVGTVAPPSTPAAAAVRGFFVCAARRARVAEFAQRAGYHASDPGGRGCEGVGVVRVEWPAEEWGWWDA